MAELSVISDLLPNVLDWPAGQLVTHGFRPDVPCGVRDVASRPHTACVLAGSKVAKAYAPDVFGEFLLSEGYTFGEGWGGHGVEEVPVARQVELFRLPDVDPSPFESEVHQPQECQYPCNDDPNERVVHYDHLVPLERSKL